MSGSRSGCILPSAARMACRHRPMRLLTAACSVGAWCCRHTGRSESECGHKATAVPGTYQLLLDPSSPRSATLYSHGIKPVCGHERHHGPHSHPEPTTDPDRKAAPHPGPNPHTSPSRILALYLVDAAVEDVVEGVGRQVDGGRAGPVLLADDEQVRLLRVVQRILRARRQGPANCENYFGLLFR